MKKIFKSLINLRSYLNFLIVFILSILLFVVGIVAFSIAVSVIAFVSSLALAVFIYKFVDLDIFSFKIDTFGEAIIVNIVGIILLAILLYLVNKLVAAFNKHISFQVGKFKFGKR
jgi:hypothetical protein